MKNINKTLLDIKIDLENFYKTNWTKNVSFKVEILKKLRNNIKKNEEDILIALNKDLNKSKKESYIAEYISVLNEIDLFIRKIKNWSRPKRCLNTYETIGCKSVINYHPKGLVIIITPFNYPFYLTMMPLIGAIGAGNVVLIKNSSSTPNINEVIKKIIDETFFKNHISVITPDLMTNYNDLYELKPNMIFFTGSNQVGTYIAKQCAERNIEYITEMGGKSPCVIDKTVQLDKVIKRIVWSKLLNAGQTCIAPDYFLVHQKIYDKFVDKLIKEIKIQYPDVLKNNNIPKIINNKSFNKLTKIIDDLGNDNIIFGGNTDSKKLLIEPTIIQIRNKNKLYNLPELFGPLFTLIEYRDIYEMWEIIENTDKTPLAAYFYSETKNNIQNFINIIQSGSICINDSITQILNHRLPFGGYMSSGFGNYHGKYSFLTFSFLRTTLINKNRKDVKIKFINNEISYQKTKKLLSYIRKIIR